MRLHPCSCWELQVPEDDVHGLSQVVDIGIRLHLGVVFIGRPGRRQRGTAGQGQDPKEAPCPWSSCAHRARQHQGSTPEVHIPPSPVHFPPFSLPHPGGSYVLCANELGKTLQSLNWKRIYTQLIN